MMPCCFHFKQFARHQSVPPDCVHRSSPLHHIYIMESEAVAAAVFVMAGAYHQFIIFENVETRRQIERFFLRGLIRCLQRSFKEFEASGWISKLCMNNGK